MNRRQLLSRASAVATVALLPRPAFAGLGLHGVAPGGGGGGGYTVVGPSAGWNGTGGSATASTWANSSTGVPVQVAPRSTAMPIMRWWQSSWQRDSGNLMVAVFADANGGMSKVTFGGDIPDTDATLQYYTRTGGDGRTQVVPVWAIQINCPAAVAMAAKGTLRIYARGFANDNTMQSRCIGPLHVYPRALVAGVGGALSVYDWDVTVNPSGSNTGASTATGGNYLTLAAAMQGMKDALNSGSYECGRVTITQTGTYSLGSPDIYAFPWSYGHSRITTSAGVTATIRRNNAAFDPYRAGITPGAWSVLDPWVMYSYVDNLEFYGPGIVIDRVESFRINGSNSSLLANNLDPITGAQQRSGNFLFNGCTITNSNGTWPQTYWLGGIAPALFIGDLASDPAQAWGQDSVIEYQVQGGIFLDDCGAIFNKVRQSTGAAHALPVWVYGEYFTDSPLSVELNYRTGVNILTIGYTGSQATGTVTYNGTNTLTLVAGSVVNAIFQLADGGTGNQRLASPSLAAGSYFVLPSEIATYINANNGAGGTCEGFTTTWLSDTYAAVRMGDYYGGGFGPTNVKGSPLTLTASKVSHSEWIAWQSANSGNPQTNTAVWNCTVVNSGFSTAWVNWGGNTGGVKDLTFKHNTFDPGTSTHSEGNPGSAWGSHSMMEDVTMGVAMLCGQNLSTDSYTSIKRVIALSVGTWNGASFVDNIPHDCVILSGAVNPGAGMVALGGAGTLAQFDALFVDPTNKNWTPSGSGALASNLFTRTNDARDAQGAAWAASDAAGALKLGGSAPSWPF